MTSLLAMCTSQANFSDPITRYVYCFLDIPKAVASLSGLNSPSRRRAVDFDNNMVAL
jgi:hypothetical protein